MSVSATSDAFVPPRGAAGEADSRAAPGSTPRTCRHCGTPSGREEFCCAGCAYVHRLIFAEGLEGYYDIKDEISTPVDVAVDVPRDFGWLRPLQQAAEEEASPSGRAPRVTVAVQGLSCAGCGWLIERLFRKQSGAGRMEVDATRGLLRLSWTAGEFDAVGWAQTLQRFNYLLGPAGQVSQARPETRELGRRIGLCAAFALNIMLFTLPSYFGMSRDFEYAGLFALLALMFATLSLLTGGGYFVGRAVRALREGAVHIDLPIALGVVGAYAGSVFGWWRGEAAYQYFDFVGTFILLMLVGRWTQVAAVERNQRRLLRERPLVPPVRIAGGREVPVDQLKVGDRFEVGPGGKVPVGAKLVSTEAALSLAWINGEAEPLIFRACQAVPAGAQNLNRTWIRCEALEGWSESTLAELLQPVERADAGQGVMDHVVRGYVVGILGLAMLAAVGWWWSTGDLLRTGAVVTAVLVVSCPCALGLAWPLADELATVGLRRRGVFLRRGDVWGRLARVRRVVFDKTGTLTLETPALRNPTVLAGLGGAARSALTSLVASNPHPVALALHEALLWGGPVELLAGQVTEHIGQGVKMGEWRLGRAGWATGGGDEAASPASAHVVLSRAGEIVAEFWLEDTARADARQEVGRLRGRGLSVAILSGDHPSKVAKLADALGIASGQAKGGLSPWDKAAWLVAHGADESLMLGDGANDSLAFDQALVRGTPVIHRGALEAKADFYYLGRGIGGVRALLEVADRRRRTLAGLIGFSVVYNLGAVGVAMAGLMSPLLAAGLMPASSLITLAMAGGGLRGVGRTQSDT